MKVIYRKQKTKQAENKCNIKHEHKNKRETSTKLYKTTERKQKVYH